MSMKTLYIHPNNDFTGSTKVLSNVLSDSACKVDILTRHSESGCLTDLKNVNLITPFILKVNGRTVPGLTSLIWRIHSILILLLIAPRYECIYINTILPSWAAVIARLYRKQVVYHIHEKFTHKTREIRFAEYVFNHIKAKRIFVSNYLKDQYPDNGSETCVQYNRLSSGFISNVKIKPVEDRDRKNITMISSLSAIKGVDTFIELSRCLTEYTFHLVLSADTENINAYFGNTIPDNVRIYSQVPNVGEVLEQTDLLLNLTQPKYIIETFGMTILEAMAYGIPSVVPNVGGPKELVQNGYNGYSVDVSDVVVIKDVIKEAFTLENYEKLCSGALNKFKAIQGTL